MLVLILGLAVFIGSHLVRAVAPDWRDAQIARRGEGAWKGVYSVVSLVGLVLIVWGYGMARQDPIPLYFPPTWLAHLALLLNLLAFLLLGVYLAPAGRLKARLGHPMVLGVKTWALAHLMANGTLADVLLFGSLLVWAVMIFVAERRRDRAAGVVRVAGPVRNDVIALAIGVALWAAFILFLHRWLIGVDPLAV